MRDLGCGEEKELSVEGLPGAKASGRIPLSRGAKWNPECCPKLHRMLGGRVWCGTQARIPLGVGHL